MCGFIIQNNDEKRNKHLQTILIFAAGVFLFALILAGIFFIIRFRNDRKVLQTDYFEVLTRSADIIETIKKQESSDSQDSSELTSEEALIPTQISQVKLGDIPGFKPFVTDATPESAVLRFCNYSDETVYFGTYFYIETLIDKDWFVYPELDHSLIKKDNWTSYAIALKPGEMADEDLLWGDFYYGSLPDGSYRVIKEYLYADQNEDEKQLLASYFKLEDHTFKAIDSDLPYDSPYVTYIKHFDLDGDGKEEEITATYYHELWAALLSNEVMGFDRVHMMLTVDNSEIAGLENDDMDGLDILPFMDGFVIITYEKDTVGNHYFDVFTYNGLKVSLAGRINGSFEGISKGIIKSLDVFENQVITDSEKYWTIDSFGKIIAVDDPENYGN